MGTFGGMPEVRRKQLQLVWYGRDLVAIEGAAAPADRGGLTQA